MNQDAFAFVTLDTGMSSWQEVPQPRFDSWPPAMQRAYCAARDEDAALFESDPWWQEFYRARGAAYREQ